MNIFFSTNGSVPVTRVHVQFAEIYFNLLITIIKVIVHMLLYNSSIIFEIMN